MRPLAYSTRSLWLIAVFLAVGAFFLMPALAVAQECIPPAERSSAAVVSCETKTTTEAVVPPSEVTPHPLTITLTNKGISKSADKLDGGLYMLTIKNDSSRSRGVVLTGVDLGVSKYIRFSKVLRPGQEETFRWYFPDDRSVQVRDLLACKHAERTCVVAREGSLSSSIVFT